MRINENSFLINRPIAHRGLHNDKIAENSKTAFENAIENNYPIEMDVQFTKDFKLAVFHDDSLLRMTGVDSLIWDKNFDDISKLKLGNTVDTIMLFSDFLKLIGGKVPLLIEIKDQREKGIVEKILEELKDYKGEFALQSFNPFYIGKIKKLAPEILRGQLSSKFIGNNMLGVKKYLLSNLKLAFWNKPDFITYCHSDVSNKLVKKVEKLNVPLICWTLTTDEDLQKVKPFIKNYIFEKLKP